jgi:uncharacterized protein (DUF488 family)
VTEAPAEARLFTVGHSTHPLDTFLALVRRHAITAVADVRSSPFSRFNPQYNSDALAESLASAGIRYVFLGKELGARRAEADCYEGQKAHYELIAQSPLFHRGLHRVRCGIESYRVALLCAESDHLTCHRTILICRHLRRDAGPIYHILDNGELEPQADAEARLLSICGLPQHDLFRSREELVEHAYDIQGDRIAYVAAPDQRENSP